MSTFTKVENGTVVQVIVAEQDFIDTLPDKDLWIKNTEHEVVLRKNYAGIGYAYDAERDAFVPPKPEEGEWALNEETCLWEESVTQPA